MVSGEPGSIRTKQRDVQCLQPIKMILGGENTIENSCLQ